MGKAYKEKGQEHVWKKMSKADQKKEIVKNRNNSSGKGKKFAVEITERVLHSDFLQRFVRLLTGMHAIFINDSCQQWG